MKIANQINTNQNPSFRMNFNKKTFQQLKELTDQNKVIDRDVKRLCDLICDKETRHYTIDAVGLLQGKKPLARLLNFFRSTLKLNPYKTEIFVSHADSPEIKGKLKEIRTNSAGELLKGFIRTMEADDFTQESNKAIAEAKLAKIKS